MSSLRSIPDDEGPNSASAEGTEQSAAGTYIHSVISMFPSLLPPLDDYGYDSHAPRKTLISPHLPSATEISRATKGFVAGKLRAYVMPDDVADIIRLEPGTSIQLPIVGGMATGVTGSLFIPDAGDQTKSNARAELMIRLASGPALDSDFGSIYVDPDLDTMDGWTEGGKERRLMSYWAGKVVLPPAIPAAGLLVRSPAVEFSE